MLTVKNTGNGTLTINNVDIGGTNASDFTITADTATGASLGSNQSATVTVEFDPSASGSRTATLTVTSNVSPVAASLSGTGTNAVIAVADVDFGAVPIGSTGTGAITVSNNVATDPGQLHITSAAMPTGTWFSFDTNTPASCLGATTCTLNMDVTTTAKTIGVLCQLPAGATGSQTTMVTFTSDTDPGGTSVAMLSCTTGRMDIDVVTTALDFGDVPINPSPAPTKTVTIGNTGTLPLTFTAAKVSSTFSSLYTLGGCATACTVPAGMTAQFTVTFNPMAITNPNANISITVTSNDSDPGDRSIPIPVAGRGVTGLLAVSVPPGGGTSINFGAVPQGAAVTQTFTLTNNGNIAVNNIATVVNPNTKGYSVDPPLPTMLAAGASATLTARFAPQSGSDGGPATVTFTGNSGATPPQTTAVLSLDGDGQSAGITVTKMTLDFGNLRYDTTPTATFCIANPNETSAMISPITIAPGMGTMSGEFAVTKVLQQTMCGTGGSSVTLPATLATGQFFEVTVQADPANRTGMMQATLTVPTNLAATPTRTVALLGNSTSGNFKLAPGPTLDFGTVDVQVAAGSTKTITITNIGDGNLDLTSFARTANARFTLTLPGNTTLAPNQSLDIPVTYKPTTARPAGSEETITLSHSIGGDIDGPAMNMIVIKGRGIDRVLSLGPTPTFPDTFRNPGDQAPVRSMAITNMGEATLKVSAAMITTNTDVWQLLDTAPVDIPQGATQEFRVRFAPKIAGRAPPATLMITHDDDMKPPVAVPLTGNGIDRSVMFAPNTIRLGYTGVGVPVTVDGALIVASMDATHTFLIRAIELDEGSPFTIEGLSPDLELLPLSERKFSMTFTAPKEGEFFAKAHLYLDMDPDATHEVTIEGTAVFANAHGGGGCTAGAANGSADGALLGMAALFGLRRRRRTVTAGAAAAVLALLASLMFAPAEASADDIALSVFDPVPATTSNGFQLQSPEVGANGDWVASAVISHATDPLTIDFQANGTFINDDAVISRSTEMNLGGAIAFLDRFEAGARLPLYAQEGQPIGDPQQGATTRPAEGTARGDLVLHAKMRLLRRRLAGDGSLVAGTGVQLTLPTSTRDQFTGLDHPSARALLLGSLTPGAFERRVTLTMNLGAVLRARSTYANLEQKSGVAWGIGVQVRALDALYLAAEIYGDTVPASHIDEMTHSHVLSPSEWLAGVRWTPDRRFTIGLGAGRGLTSAVGTPAFRGVLSLTLTPGAHEVSPIRPKPPQPRIVDTDGDGIPDNKDKCPNEPEDRNGIRDDDGCPDADADHDGIVDVHDKCPQQAEDRDGFQDEDGCPDPDNDGDGIPDAQDECPMQPETINGIDDDDGCPDSGGDTGTQIGVDPNQSPVQAAEATFQRGRDLMKEQKYFAACASFEQSQRLDPKTGTKYNLALCYTEIGKLATALSMFRELVQVDKNVDRRAESSKRVTDLATRVAKLKLSLAGTPPGVNVYMNGTNVNALIGIETPIDFGTYTIVAGAPGYRGWRQTIEVKKDGEIVPVDIDLGPPMKP